MHQDLYGDVAFPFQALTVLSRKGEDFDGGESVLIEQRPRQQSRAHVISLNQGELLFFPTRAQLRVQTAFISSSNGTQVPFDDLASRSDAAAQAIDAAVERLAGVTVPRDLEALNAELVKALQDATRASASLTHAAYACQLSMSSVERCQVPFSGASTRLAKAYERYLGVRGRIREKVLDTDTHMTPFSR